MPKHPQNHSWSGSSAYKNIPPVSNVSLADVCTHVPNVVTRSMSKEADLFLSFSFSLQSNTHPFSSPPLLSLSLCVIYWNFSLSSLSLQSFKQRAVVSRVEHSWENSRWWSCNESHEWEEVFAPAPRNCKNEVVWGGGVKRVQKEIAKSVVTCISASEWKREEGMLRSKQIDH